MRLLKCVFVILALAAAACTDSTLLETSAPEAITLQGNNRGPTYSITPLPRPDAPPGFSPGTVTALNASVAVGWVRSETNEFQAAQWIGGELLELPGLVEGAISQATDINARGDIVGSSENDAGEMRAVLWRQGSPRDLGTLGGAFSAAHGINDQGDVVGVAETADGELHAFLWTQGRMEDLGRLPGTEWSMAVAINVHGEIVGHSIGGDVVQRATLWRGGEIIDLNTLGNESGAVAINSRGQIVGGSIPFHQTEARAVIWEEEEIRDLGSLDDSFSSAGGINDRGQVVGATRAPDCDQCPFLWERGSMRNLGTLDGALASATDINQSGTVGGNAGDGIGPLLWERGPAVVAGRHSSAQGPRNATGASTASAPAASRAWAAAVCGLKGPIGGADSALEIAAGC